MRKIVAAVLVWCFASGGLAAESLVAKDQSGNSMTLLNQPCEGALLEQITLAAAVVPGEKKYQRGVMFYAGKSYDACWFAYNDTVLILDSAGDKSAIPMTSFKDLSI